MSERRIELRIAASETTCGQCRGVLRVGEHVSCMIFGLLGLTRTRDGKDFERLSGCLAAEQATQPWKADEDDDDPMPHHFRESTR